MPQIKKKVNSERITDPVARMLISMGYDGENFRVNMNSVPTRMDRDITMMSRKVLEFVKDKYTEKGYEECQK
jgi:hypothetical protein